ncbi:hypothetical protein MKEN_00399200 [Mycena kentingensis (nom. inval.)]|nr:hypothetical protein MKEN_00399200 [Mycena kentingensis (nom. inval.)]
MLSVEEARRLSRRDMKAYLAFAFPREVTFEDHDPWFSLSAPANWVTSLGYKIFTHSTTDVGAGAQDIDIDDISGGELEDFCAAFVAPQYIAHAFFSIDRADKWVQLPAFLAWKLYTAPSGSSRPHPIHIPPLSPSLHSAPSPSRPVSRASQVSYSVASSPPGTRAGSVAPSRASSRRSASLDLPRIPLPSSSIASPNQGPVHKPALQRSKGKGRASGVGRVAPHPSKFETRTTSRAATSRIYITREWDAERIIQLTKAPSTWTIDDNAVYRLDLSESKHLFQPRSSRAKSDYSIQRVIRAEDQDSWRSSGGHADGDGEVFGFFDDVSIGVQAKRIHHHCNGVRICELVPEELFADCERYAPDPAAALDLWHHQLDANENEARSVGSILLRFYTRIINTECPLKGCDGKPVLTLMPNAPNQFGKMYYVGCSEADATTHLETLQHIYIPIPVSLNEDHLKFVVENDGLLPEGISIERSDTCVLSLHPSNTMKHCRYGHSLNGQVKAAKVVERPCEAELIVFVPTARSDGAPAPEWFKYVALVIARNFHNHPVHLQRKPSLEEEQRVRALISTIGLEGLTAQRLLDHPITRAEYNGARLPTVNPGFANKRRLKDLIHGESQEKYPHGQDWDGVVHYMSKIQPTLKPAEHYIHVAVKMSNFSIVVTMHHGLAEHLHSARYICIDFTFKRVAGMFNEWKIAIFIDRYNMRIAVGTLYCDRNTREAFEQLFIHFFGTVKRVTGRELGLRPWRPDAACRVVILDGEVAQAQGFGDFLVGYNDPSISNIHSRDPLELVTYTLKSCQVHYTRNIRDKLPISHSDKDELCSWPSKSTQEAIDTWHAFCANHPHESVRNFYAQKLANPWYLVSMNAYQSKIAPDDWNITPDSTNIVESEHASLNAKTQIRLPLLSAILGECDAQKRKHDELQQIETGGAIANHRNGLAERERSASQRAVSKMRHSALRAVSIADYHRLQTERDEVDRRVKASLAEQRTMNTRIEEIKTSRRTVHKEEVTRLRKEVKAGLEGRRLLKARLGILDVQIAQLRRGELQGVRIPRAPSRSRTPEHAGAGENEDLTSRLGEGGECNYGDANVVAGDAVAGAELAAAGLGLGSGALSATTTRMDDDGSEYWQHFPDGLDSDVLAALERREQANEQYDQTVLNEMMLAFAPDPGHSSLILDPELQRGIEFEPNQMQLWLDAPRLPTPPPAAQPEPEEAPVASASSRRKRADTAEANQDRTKRTRRATNRALGLSYEDEIITKK